LKKLAALSMEVRELGVMVSTERIVSARVLLME